MKIDCRLQTGDCRPKFQLKMLFIVFCLQSAVCSLQSPCFAADSNNTQNTVDMQKAREEYRIFLQKLKQLNGEYKQVTGQMAQIIKEEGVPTWDSVDLDEPAERVSFKQTADEWIVSVNMPGIKKDTIRITVREGINLSLSADPKDSENPQKVEIQAKLPVAVKDTGAKASYEDGVVTIRFTKLPTQEVVVSIQ